MLKATEKDVLQAFEKVHGRIAGQCYTELVYGYEQEGDDEVVAVAVMKDGQECWRASLTEIMFDLMIERGQAEAGDA